MGIVIYARVSTEAQEKQQTIESQLAELRRHARGVPRLTRVVSGAIRDAGESSQHSC